MGQRIDYREDARCVSGECVYCGWPKLRPAVEGHAEYCVPDLGATLATQAAGAWRYGDGAMPALLVL